MHLASHRPFVVACVTCFGVMLGVILPASAEVKSDRKVKEIISQISESSRKTAERFQTEAAQWTSRIQVDNSSEMQFAVHKMQTPSCQLVRVEMNTGKNATELVRIIARDGRWFVTEPGRRYVCWPYEAPLFLPVLYRFIGQSDLRVAGPIDEVGQLGTFESVEDNVAHFRTPIPSAQAATLRAASQAMEQLLNAGSKKVNKDEIRKQLAANRELLERGVRLSISLEHGLLLDVGDPGRRVTVEGFRWLEAPDAAAISVEGVNWEDATVGIAVAAEMADVAMLSHCRSWQPGNPTPDLDVVTVNLKTGRFVRVPYDQGICLGGCFSSDRSKVYVTGMIATGGAGLFEIDLTTRVNRQLAVGQIHGMPVGPVLSPDGETLIVAQLSPGLHTAAGDSPANMLTNQYFLVDIATGDARPVGQPLDANVKSWLPDGNSLLLTARKHVAMDKPSLDSVALLKLDGTLTLLRPGSSASLVLGGTRILYEEGDPRQWFTCDLTGGDPQRVGDGLSRFAFPAPSFLGDRVLMMRFGQPEGPRPHIVDIRTGVASPVPVGSGFWASPRWK